MPGHLPNTRATQPQLSRARGEQAGRVDAVIRWASSGWQWPGAFFPRIPGVRKGLPLGGGISKPGAAAGSVAHVSGGRLPRCGAYVVPRLRVRAPLAIPLSSFKATNVQPTEKHHESTHETGSACSADLGVGRAGRLIAAIDISKDSNDVPDSYKYAKETLSGSAANVIEGKDAAKTMYYRVTANNNTLDFRFTAGVGIQGGQDQALLHVTLTDMTFGTEPRHERRWYQLGVDERR